MRIKNPGYLTGIHTKFLFRLPAFYRNDGCFVFAEKIQLIGHEPHDCERWYKIHSGERFFYKVENTTYHAFGAAKGFGKNSG